jgi:hypothetical protein
MLSYEEIAWASRNYTPQYHGEIVIGLEEYHMSSTKLICLVVCGTILGALLYLTIYG